MKYACLLIFLLSFNINGSSQNIWSFVPKNVEHVAVCHGNELEQTLEVKALTSTQEFQEYIDYFNKSFETNWSIIQGYLIYKGQSVGVNTNNIYCNYRLLSDSLEMDVSVFEVTNGRLLDEFLLENFSEDIFKRKEILGNFEALINDHNVLLWNDHFIIIYDAYIPYEIIRDKIDSDADYYLEELSDRERNERDVQIENIKRDLLRKHVDKLTHLPFNKTLLSELNFMNLLSESFLSLQYKPTLNAPKLLKNRIGSPDIKQPSNFEISNRSEGDENIHQNNYSYVLWKSVDGNIVSESNYKLNKDLLKYAKQISKAEINKDFFKYISGEDVIGYFATALNPKGIYDLIEVLMGNNGDLISNLFGNNRKPNMPALSC